MEKQLKQFDLLCENIQMNILGQKKHSFLHNLRPFARRNRYIQQDFLTLWNDSCLQKLKGALLGTKLNFRIKQIKVPNGQRDIYLGTTRPGVFLRYSIIQKDQKYLIKEILRKLKANSDNDVLATWRAYLQEQIELCQTQNKKFSLPMELQIVARIKPKDDQSFQQKKVTQITQLNSNGFNGNIYLWFDLSKFKEQIKNVLEKNKDNTDYLMQQAQQNNQSQQQINLHLTSPTQDKILLGDFDITIIQSNKLGLIGLGEKILTGHADDLVGNAVNNIFGRLTGSGESKDSSERPKLIRKHLSLFSTAKPYVQVKSVVNLQDWLYDIQQSPQRKYLGKEGSKQNVSGLTKFPFVLANIKKGYDPRETTQLSQNKCWTTGNYSGNSKWEYNPITKDWLLDDTHDHLLTLRFQSWIKRNNGYYFDYRFVFNLNGFYNIAQTIESLYHERSLNIASISKKRGCNNVNKIEDFLDNLLKDNNRLSIDENQLSQFEKNEKDTINQLLGQLKYKKSCKNIVKKEAEQKNFVLWFKSYIKQMERYRPDEFTKASVDKIIYNNKNQMVSRDSHIQSSFQAFKQRDITGFEFLQSILENINNYTVEGETLNSIFANK